jgi:hypothetical protein
MDILTILKTHDHEMKNLFTVKRIGLFGSFARDEGSPESDVDILVEFEEPTFDNFMGLIFYLEDLLERDVDLLTVNSLSTHIRPYIESEVIWCEH